MAVEKTMMETAFKKEISVLNRDNEYKQKEIKRLRAIVQDREDYIALLLQGDESFERIKKNVDSLKESLTSISLTTN
jgi:predicted translin family RNA/ssDNA-binding protein